MIDFVQIKPKIAPSLFKWLLSLSSHPEFCCIRMLLEFPIPVVLHLSWSQFCGSFCMVNAVNINMKLEAVVKYGNGRARFKISKENPGIYYANLLHFDGSKEFCPPSEITLIRGVRQWTGSHEDEALLNDLGKVIEQSFNKPKVN